MPSYRARSAGRRRHVNRERVMRHGRIGQHLAWLFVVGSGFISQGLITISGVLTARLLGVEGRGELAFVVALAWMASQLTLGGSLPNAITKRLADNRVTARDGLRPMMSRWWLEALLASVVFAAVLVLARGDVSSQTLLLALALLLLAVQNMISRIVTSALLGEGASLGRVGLAAILPQALATGAIAVAAVVVDDISVFGIAMLMVAATTIALAVSIFLFAVPSGEEAAALDRRDLSALRRKTYISSIGPIDGLSLDRALVGALLGAAPLGLYTAATALANLTSTLGTGLAVVLLQRVASAQGGTGREERALVSRWLVVGAVVMAVIAGASLLVADPVIRLAFGDDFAPAVPVAYWLLPAAALLGYRRVLIAILQGRERGGLASRIELTLTPVVVAGIYIASLRDSVVGVGVAMLVAAASAVLALMVAVSRTAVVPARDPADPELSAAAKHSGA